MTKKLITTVFIVSLAGMIAGCSSQSEQSEAAKKKQLTPITVYGDATCDHCIELMTKLDLHNLTYTFHDVQRNLTRANEMIMKIQAIDYRGNVSLPVLEVGGELLVSPTIDQVIEKVKVED